MKCSQTTQIAFKHLRKWQNQGTHRRTIIRSNWMLNTCMNVRCLPLTFYICLTTPGKSHGPTEPARSQKIKMVKRNARTNNAMRETNTKQHNNTNNIMNPPTHTDTHTHTHMHTHTRAYTAWKPKTKPWWVETIQQHAHPGNKLSNETSKGN